jgi:hypothetical protein
LFLAGADDGTVVGGASVQVKPEAHKGGLFKSRPSFFKVNLQKESPKFLS